MRPPGPPNIKVLLICIIVDLVRIPKEPTLGPLLANFDTPTARKVCTVIQLLYGLVHRFYRIRLFQYHSSIVEGYYRGITILKQPPPIFNATPKTSRFKSDFTPAFLLDHYVGTNPLRCANWTHGNPNLQQFTSPLENKSKGLGSRGVLDAKHDCI